MEKPIIILIILALTCLEYRLIKSIVVRGRKNASKIFPPKRMEVIYKRKLVNEVGKMKLDEYSKKQFV